MLSSEAVSALEDADEYVYKSTLTHPSASPVFKYRSASWGGISDDVISDKETCKTIHILTYIFQIRTKEAKWKSV